MKKLESPSPKDAGSGKKIFKVDNVLLYYLPLEKGMDFIWINIISLYLWMLCAKFSWNWANGSGKEDFFRVVDVCFPTPNKA